MATKWTDEQQAVIDSRDCNLLVAAAAGSGKTAVLIERIIQLVLDEKNPIDIDRLLVVTFTKAAAAEMKERVAIAIENKLEINPENQHLQKQVILLNKAEITTIDSFCRNVVKNNFHVTDLDPSVKVADPTEINIVASEVMEQLFEELYSGHDDDFLRLVDWYGNKNGDESLANLLLMINTFISSFPYPEKWLEESAEFFNIDQKDESFFIKSYMIPFTKDVYLYLKSIKESLIEINRALFGYNDLEKYLENCRNILEGIENIIYSIESFFENENLKSWLHIQNSILEYNSILSNLNNVRKSNKWEIDAVDVYTQYKDIVSDYRKGILECINSLDIDVDILKSEHIIVYPYMRAITNVVKKFREKFAIKKKNMGVLDFADMEHYALEILSDFDESGNVLPSKVALSYRDRYEEVFTDEYQDSNLIQEVILSLVSRNANPNRFMVGDVKQSIYRFRQAMPEIFMEKYKTYNSKKNKKILLYNNFRSRTEVLEGCNHVFKSIMRKETGELDYTDEERLNHSAKFEDCTEINAHVGGPIEIYLSDTSKKNSEQNEYQKNSEENAHKKNTKDKISQNGVEKTLEDKFKNNFVEMIDDYDELSNFEIESKNIANIIYNMVNQNDNSKYMVYDKRLEKYRPVEYKDIAILMMTPRAKAPMVEEKLFELGIPSYSESSSGYFTTIEVTTIENLLKIIDNPMQDVPLLSVMRSPIFNFNSNDMAKIRLYDRDCCFYECIKSIYDEINNELEQDRLKYIDGELKAKLVYFMDTINRYREKSYLLPIDEFLWYIYDDTNYYNYVGVLELGEQRQNNLKLLYERARQYENSSYKGLFNFINYIQRVKNKSGDLGEAKNISEDANVVRIMSIHKSKGLEFPIVILANSDKKFNLKSGDSSLSLHQNYGYGPIVYNFDKNIKYNSYIKNKIDLIQQKEQIAEEMRLLYVAMTRAKEKLIITGNVSDYEKVFEYSWKNFKKNEDGELDSYEILSKRTFLDWIMPSIANFNIRGKFFDVCGNERNYIGYGDCKWSIDVKNRVDIINENLNLQNIKLHTNNIENTDILNKKNEINNVDVTDKDDELLRIKNNQNSATIYTEEKMSYESEEFCKLKEQLDLNFGRVYEHFNSASKPASISVSEVKRIISEDDEYHEKMYKKRYSSDLKIPKFMHSANIGVEFSAAEKGTIFHLVMQLLDIQKFKDIRNDIKLIKIEIERQLLTLVEKNILNREECNTVSIDRIIKFIKSDIFEEILWASENNLLYKEKAINYSIRVNEIYKNQNIPDEERMMIVGIIDLFFENKEGNIVLIDYKTDFVTIENRDDIISKYKIQLELYKKAIEEISGKKVCKKYIYLFSIGELIEY